MAVLAIRIPQRKGQTRACLWIRRPEIRPAARLRKVGKNGHRLAQLEPIVIDCRNLPAWIHCKILWISCTLLALFARCHGRKSERALFYQARPYHCAHGLRHGHAENGQHRSSGKRLGADPVQCPRLSSPLLSSYAPAQRFWVSLEKMPLTLGVQADQATLCKELTMASLRWL